MRKKHTNAPIARYKLVVIYVALWLGTGSLAALFHLTDRPHYISFDVCIRGGVANLFGPWARPLAAGWPNAGKPPHAPLPIIGAVLLAIFVVLILVSMKSRKRWLQILCVGLFVPAILFWILLGFVELLHCAL